MKRCPDNQIKAAFIDISRIKWLVFSSSFEGVNILKNISAPQHFSSVSAVELHWQINFNIPQR